MEGDESHFVKRLGGKEVGGMDDIFAFFVICCRFSLHEMHMMKFLTLLPSILQHFFLLPLLCQSKNIHTHKNETDFNPNDVMCL